MQVRPCGVPPRHSTSRWPRFPISLAQVDTSRSHSSISITVPAHSPDPGVLFSILPRPYLLHTFTICTSLIVSPPIGANTWCGLTAELFDLPPILEASLLQRAGRVDASEGKSLSETKSESDDASSESVSAAGKKSESKPQLSPRGRATKRYHDRPVFLPFSVRR